MSEGAEGKEIADWFVERGAGAGSGEEEEEEKESRTGPFFKACLKGRRGGERR